MIKRIDHQKCQDIRNENFNTYQQSLFGSSANGPLPTDSGYPPLYYPLDLGRDAFVVRQRLIEQNIFIPTLWMNTVGELNEDEKSLRDNLLLLPLDYRYAKIDIETISDIVIKTLKAN